MNKRIFTLVELIVVITIISVLSVISVLIVSEWIGKSRDTRRIGDVSQIEKAVDLSKVTSNTFPTPDNYVIGSAMYSSVVYKGVFGNGAVSKTSIKSAPKDPTTDSNYIYSISSDGNYYQLAYVLENGSKVTFLKENVYAANPIAGVKGNYKGVLTYTTGSNYYVANIPSLIFTSSTGADLLSTGTYFVVHNKENLPYTLGNINTTDLKDTVTLIKEVINSGAALTAANITQFYTNKTDLSYLISGDILNQFGGLNKLNILGSSLGLSNLTGYVSTGSTINSFLITLLHFDGGSIVDSTGRHTYSVSSGSGSNSALLSGTQSKFGGSSLYAPGGGYIVDSSTNTSDRNFSGAFTMEAWIYPISVTNDARFWAFGYNQGFQFGVHNGKLSYSRPSGAYNDSATISLNAWHHVAISRDENNTTRTFLDGVLAGTYANDTGVKGQYPLRIGSDAQVRFIGYIDDFRAFNGVAVYTGNFTLPSAPF